MQSGTKSVALAALLVVATVTGVTFATAPAAAQSDETVLSGVFDGDSSEQARALGSAVWSGIGASMDRALWATRNSWVGTSVFGENTISASEEADGVASYYNANNATLESWINSRKNVSENHTVEVTLHIGDSSATRYVVANASNGNITRSEMVSSTNRTAAHSVDLCGFAAEQATEELRYFSENYASEEKDVDGAYLGRMKGRYSEDVETTLYNSSGSCGGGV